MALHRLSLIGLVGLAFAMVGCNAEPTLPSENADAGLAYRGATGDVATPSFAPREREPLTYGGAGSVQRAGKPVEVPWNNKKLPDPTPADGKSMDKKQEPKPEAKTSEESKSEEKKSESPKPMSTEPKRPQGEEKKTEDKQSAIMPLAGELLAMNQLPAEPQKKS